MNNLLKMERYQLLHNRMYWLGLLGMILIGLLSAESYVPEAIGPTGGPAASLTDIFNAMVYDSTFLLILLCSLLALLLGQEFSCRAISQEVCAGHPRGKIFAAKVISYLIAFNLLAILYPIAGCVREFSRFGLADAGLFFYNVGKAIFYSLVANSAQFLIAILFCCLFQDAIKAMSATAAATFVLSLYLGYGMMLKLPVGFLPIFQIRTAVTSADFFLPGVLAICFLWLGGLSALAWQKFCSCDLK